MPEEPEVETEKLQEAIHEAVESESGRLIRQIALTTALLAALAALASLLAGASVNDALILKSEAARLQSEASDQWAYYQAKGIKAAMQETLRAPWLAIGKEPPAKFDAAIKKYGDEQRQIEKLARQKEQERDAKSAEADDLFRRHNGLAKSVAMFQVAIALGAVAALTRMRLIWLVSLALGVSASGLLLAAWLQ